MFYVYSMKDTITKKQASIYHIICPESGKCVYVGQTTDIKTREANLRNNGYNNHKIQKWLYRLANKSLTPIVRVVKTVPFAQRLVEERKEILKMKPRFNLIDFRVSNRNKEIQKMYKEGNCMQVIADKYGITTQRVQQIIAFWKPDRPI